MKKALLIMALVAASLCSLLGAVTLGTYAAYRDNRFPCESPVDEDTLETFGVKLPAGVRACKKSGPDSHVSLEVLVETPSPVCLATAGIAGCTSPARSAMSFASSMATAGWDSERLESGGDQSSATFGGPQGKYASLRLNRSRYGEISGTLEVTSPKTGKGGH